MAQYEFTGEWKSQFYLPYFSTLCHSKFYEKNSHLDWIRMKARSLERNLVDIDIRDAPNMNEYPETNQVNAINHILENEEEILTEIYHVMKEEVYPYYSKLVGVNYQDHDPLNEVKNLKNCLAINEIVIDFIGKNGMAWVTYNFKSNVDPEHGLSMLFEGSKFLKYDSAYEMMYQDLLSKDEYDQYIRDINIANNSNQPRLYYPDKNKKYFKPWQLEQTKEFLKTLLLNNKDEQFKSLINQDEFNINLKFPELNHTLLEEVINLRKLHIAHYMVEKGATVTDILHQGNIYKENKTRINLIGQLGYNINQLDSNNQTLLDKYLEVSNRVFRKGNDKRNLSLKEHINLLIKYGAKINDPSKYSKLIKLWKLNNNESGGWFKRFFQ